MTDAALPAPADAAARFSTPLHLRLWSHLSATRRVWMAAHIVAVISVGLVIDRAWGWPGQHLATLWTVAVFVWLCWCGRREERVVLLLCLLIAGVGEVVLSLVWGVYDYQFGNVPLFVPPGHALLMTLGLLLARHLSVKGTWLVAALASGWASYAVVGGFDQFGVVLFGVFVLCILAGRAKSLYATMFVLALIMELYGTALGNWLWLASTPGVGLSAANPPFSAGALYCLLDLLVLAALRLIGSDPASAGSEQRRI